MNTFPSFPSTSDFLQDVVSDDVRALIKAEKSYGDSWKKRGGVGAFMMLARKWDRLENRLSNPPIVGKSDNPNADHPDYEGPQFSKYDIFEATISDERPEGIIDDIRDLRRYLILVEAHLRSVGKCPGALPKDLQAICRPKPCPPANSQVREDQPPASTLHPK